jgi:hypothetical protein
MGKPISQVKKFSNTPSWEDEVQFMEFPDGKLVMIRLVGNINVMARHWIKTLSGKMFPQWCPQMNPTTEEWETSRPCPAHDDFDDRAQKMLVGNCIVRSIQDRGHDNPVRGLMLPHAVNEDLLAIYEMIGNVDPADPEKGVDLGIKYNSKAVGNKKWTIQRGNDTPLKKSELAYEYYDFDNIIPNFDDPKVAAEYAKRMKDSMARNKYYVVQEQHVPEGTRDPFKFFKGDINGQPWTDFQELVDFRNDAAGDKATTVKKTARGDDSVERRVDDDEPPARIRHDDDDAPPAKSKRRDADDDDAPPAKSKRRDADDDDAPPAKSKASVHPDGLKSKQHPKHGEVPTCFEQYTGEPKCHRCPSRMSCIDLTKDDDL